MQGGDGAVEQLFSAQRRAMVDGQIRTFDVTDQRVIRAFSLVRREIFLPSHLRELAYSDAALTLRSPSAPGTSRGLLRPMHLARMIQGAAVGVADRVLVVAGETGYAAALMAELAQSVVSLECERSFSETALVNIRALGLGPVRAITGPLAHGSPESGPFDVIFVQGAVQTGLEVLFEQLADDGRLVAIGMAPDDPTRETGRAVRYQRSGADISTRSLFDALAPVLPEFRASPAFVF